MKESDLDGGGMMECVMECAVCSTLIYVGMMSDHRAGMYRINPVCPACKDQASRSKAEVTASR